MYDIQKTFNAKTVEEAVRILKENPTAKVVAGGTDIFIALRHHKIRDAVLINIREIEELHGVRLLENGNLWIGSGTEFDTLYRDETARKCVPMLADACNTVGSPQIRHIGTVGGNLCNGAVSADTATAFYVLDAVLHLVSADGERTIPVTELHTGPGKTQLKQKELLTGIEIPKENYENYSGQYLKFGQRNAMEISTLGVSALVRLSEDKKHIEDMKMAFGVAAPVPMRVRKLENAVKGREIGEALYEEIENSVLQELAPRDSWRASKAFREQLIRVQSVRALKMAVEKAGGEAYV